MPTRRDSCARIVADPDHGAPPQRRRRVVLYADTITDSMRTAVSVTSDGVTPDRLQAPTASTRRRYEGRDDILARLRAAGKDGRCQRSRADVRSGAYRHCASGRPRHGTRLGAAAEIAASSSRSKPRWRAANELRYEEAALLRDELVELRPGPTRAAGHWAGGGRGVLST